MSTVALIGTGGTISNAGGEPLDFLSYMDTGTVLGIDELLDRFPEVHQVATVDTVPFDRLRSKAVGPNEWVRLRAAATEALKRDDVAGVVITHGTATLEETAYFLNLTVPSQKPIVVVGAQRPSSAISSDAYLNLVNAVRVAGSDVARGCGTLVVMNDAIHAAREVTKSSNHRLQTMVSPELGPLGFADSDGRIVLYRRPTRLHTVDSAFTADEVWRSEDLPRVDVAYGYAGADGVAIDAFVDRGAAGLVVAGLPPGLNPPGQEAAMARALERGVAVVQSSRAGGGRVIQRATQRELGICVSDNLTAQSARVLLFVALTASVPRADLQDVFDRY